MIRKVMAILALCLLWSGVASAATIEVTGSDLTGWFWLEGNASITWAIALNPDTKLFGYSYTMNAEKRVSDLRLETSELLTTGNVNSYFSFPVGVTVQGPQTWPEGPSPTGLYGLKLFVHLSDTYTFTSSLAPVWGDVFLKDGDYGNYYNKGFGTDPSSAPFTYWIPTPGPKTSSGEVIIPEPGMSVLALAALVAGAVARYRKRKED